MLVQYTHIINSSKSSGVSNVFLAIILYLKENNKKKNKIM